MLKDKVNRCTCHEGHHIKTLRYIVSRIIIFRNNIIICLEDELGVFRERKFNVRIGADGRLYFLKIRLRRSEVSVRGIVDISNRLDDEILYISVRNCARG
uniref:Uncharacterized protein n=1 Tax=Myoviridae sp. ctyhJ29 TaxID=2827719 RepID=A0A8S5SGN5_9CAUD|nr:MAG TPA: hypothetical protein [Myoviridae sp. ctyhJ29]